MQLDRIGGTRLLGSATAFPSDVDAACGWLDNAAVLEALGADDRERWLEGARRWGVRQRQWLQVPGGPRSERDVVDLAVAAARRALDAAGVAAGDVDAWFLATSTPSHVTSSAAARVARRLGSTALAIELRGGGAGALQAVALACTCGARRAVVVAAEALSPLLDPGAVSASLLYADGAAALVLGAEPGGGGLYGARLGTAEVRGVPFTVPGRLPPTAAEVEAGAYRFRAPDREYQAELERVWDHAADALRPLLLEGAVFAPYPVTLPLAQRVAERLAVPWPRVSFPLAEHGCIGAAGVLSAWHHARAADARQPVGALAVGGGVTWGAISWAP